MFRLMIADDEPIVQEGIKFMVEDLFEDVEIVAVASSGREAIELATQAAPDIVFMDIKMPGINGIEAIEAIKRRNPYVKFVIISAYEQFEYAKQAVELGVRDYLLKPVNQSKIVEILKKLTGEIDEERRQRNREIENREKLERIIPILEHGFIYSLLMNTDYREEVNKYNDLFEINKETAYIMVLEFGEPDEQGVKDNKIGSGIKGHNLYPKVQNILKYKCKCIVGPMIINRVTILVYEDQKDSEYEQRVKAIRLAESIVEQIDQVLESNVSLAIGSCYKLDKIKNSLEEAMYALNQMHGERILHVNDIIEREDGVEEYTYYDIKGDETHLIQLIENGTEEEIQRELMNFFGRTEKKFHASFGDFFNITSELMVMVLSCSYRNQLDESEVGYASYLNELRSFDNTVELQNYCLQRILHVHRLISGKRHQHVSKVVSEALHFIDDHYNEEIGLNEVSKEVAVSPQYFSKIFKEEVGLNYVEYVRNKRIDIAKELLKAKELSVKEICYQIGYNDPNYFSRLFKKLVGVSPTDYK